MARSVARVLAVALWPCGVGAGFGGFKPLKDFKELQQAADAAHQALKDSGAASVVEDLRRQHSEAIDEAQAQAGAVLDQLPTMKEEAHSKLENALDNITGVGNATLKDSSFGDLVQYGKRYVDQALQEQKDEGEAALDPTEDMTPGEALNHVGVRPEGAAESTDASASRLPRGGGTLDDLPGVETVRDRDGEPEAEVRVDGVKESGHPVVAISLVAVLSLVLAGWAGFRFLSKPRRTGQPMLMDTELGEGNPVTAGFMGGSSSSSSARQLQAPQAQAGGGFTRF